MVHDLGSSTIQTGGPCRCCGQPEGSRCTCHARERQHQEDISQLLVLLREAEYYITRLPQTELLCQRIAEILKPTDAQVYQPTALEQIITRISISSNTPELKRGATLEDVLRWVDRVDALCDHDSVMEDDDAGDS